ncbi:autoinducer 2 ABC transporter substrate-binding protein [Jiella sp. M17.18]|uniref:autoinducer 2 ABC transporter substrate-binding protein n=1 Tax=Jiella sp. M17.18 TaxID=3234247 RepID=UPI0034DEC5AA
MLKTSKILLAAAVVLAASTGLSFAQQKPRVAFVPQIVGIPYFDAMKKGGDEAAKTLGVDFIYQGPVDTNPVDQLQIVQNLINQGVEAISVSVLDASSLAPVVEAAKAKNIKLFTSDSDAPKSGRALYVAQASDQGLGYTIIDEMVKRTGPDAKIGIVSGEATASNLNAWIGFMRERVKEKYPKVTLLDPQYAGGSAERAAQIAGDLMTSNPDLKGIIAVASTTCPGVGQAIETAGKVGQVVGTGYCSPNTARAYLKSGAFGYSVLWDPAELGYLTVWAGQQLIEGKEIPAKTTPEGMSHPVTFDKKTGVLLLGDPAVFTADNVDKFNF